MDTKSVIPGRIAAALRQFPPYSMLEEERVVRLAEQAEVVVYARGEFVWEQGAAPPLTALFLAQGRVEYHWSNEGVPELVDVRDVGDTLGLTALIDAEPFRVSAEVVQDSIFYALDWDLLRAGLDTSDAAWSYARRHLFWATRVGRSVSAPKQQVDQTQTGVLQAHLHGAKRIQPRVIERLVHCSPEESIEKAAHTMIEERIPCMVVTDTKRRPVGILTHTDTVRAVLVNGVSVREPVRLIMTSPVVTVAVNSSSTEAMLLMLRKKVSQVCVTEDGTINTPVLDVCSEKDLMAQSGNHPAGLLREMQQAKVESRFRYLCDEMENIARSYLESGISATFLGQICAELYDALMQRLIGLVSKEFREAGRPLPEVQWAWMAVGSDGRREQVLRTDMDNAIVFASSGQPEADEAVRRRLCEFAEKIIDRLAACGFSRCQGGVMALNPKWCQSDAEWATEVDGYGPLSDGDRILRALILFDLRHVAGDVGLVAVLRKRVFECVSANEAFQTRLAKEAVMTRPPLSFLGKLVVERKGIHVGEFDIKGRGLSPLRDAVRLLAMKLGIDAHYSTGGRLEALRAYEDYREIATLGLESYDLMLRLRTLTGLRRGDSGRYIVVSEFTKMERAQLANCFDVLRLLQARLNSMYNLDTRSR